MTLVLKLGPVAWSYNPSDGELEFCGTVLVGVDSGTGGPGRTLRTGIVTRFSKLTCPHSGLG